MTAKRKPKTRKRKLAAQAAVRTQRGLRSSNRALKRIHRPSS